MGILLYIIVKNKINTISSFFAFYSDYEYVRESIKSDQVKLLFAV